MRSIKEDKVNTYWGISINSFVGYSSIEIAAMGVPSVFWNTETEMAPEYVEKQTKGMMIAPNRIEEFIESNLKYLESNESLEEFSVRQRKYIIDKHNIVNRIGDFEDYVNAVKINQFVGMKSRS